mgnify:CR=1 FL=1
MEKEEITIELLYRKLENRLTEEEVKHFEMWMQDIDHQRYYWNLQSFYELREDGRPDSAEVNRAWIDLQSRINKQGLKPGRNRLLWRGVVAASIIILLGVIPLIVPQDVKNVSSEAEIQIRPGHRNAILELADGKVYNLTNLEYGGNNRISENIIVDSCCLDYLRPDTLIPVALAWHKVIVPRGGEFQISLEDGTRVWLNSESTLKYPEVFTGTTREVFLEGEAYFEVAKDKDKPFIVKTKEQSIEALGTKFNVSAYPTDSLLTTTLLEGSVLLTTQNLLHPTVLKPNEQFVYNKRTRSALLQQVDANRFVSWTTGYYYFPEQSLEAILYRLSHVYGVQFTVKSEALNRRTFTGTFYRGQSIKDIMEIIHLSIPIRYKIDDHHVTISEI